MSKLRVIFMGTPDFVIPVLDALMGSHHDVIAVYSQPPRPSGRGYDLKKSAVHERADTAGLHVFTPKSLKGEDEQKRFSSLNADVAIVAGYGMLLPKAVLDTPKYGCINVHVSLLPRWRGASPVQFAIWKGDKETGTTVMKMDVGMDTGDIIAQKTLPITNTTKSLPLYHELFTIGGAMVASILDDIENIKTVPQDHGKSTSAPMLKKSDARIDWFQSAEEIDRQIRALDPWPGTFCQAGKKRLKILSAIPTAGSGSPGTVLNRAGIIACGKDALQLITIQPDGGNRMDIAAAINGNLITVGEKLS